MSQVPKREKKKIVLDLTLTSMLTKTCENRLIGKQIRSLV